jgi:hypothetical protein
MKVGVIKKLGSNCMLAICGVLFLTGTGFAYEINDKLSIGGVMAGIYQYESLSDTLPSSVSGQETA